VRGADVSGFGRIPSPPADRDAYLTWAQTRVHRQRVERGRVAIRRAAALGPIVVSMSFGKDSTAMGDLVIDTLGSVPFCTMPGTRDLPGGEHVRAHFEARTIVHDIPRTSGLDHMAWCKLVGLAHERDAATQSRVVGQQKRAPGTEWCKARGFAVQCIGLRLEESVIRRMLLLGRGDVYMPKSGVGVCCPLAWWEARDVWAWIFSRGLPYHPLYDCETHGQTRETLRNSGWLATDGADRGRIAWLRTHYPEQYHQLVAEFPRVAQISG
jgi:phosphoadenosine phosphosulfate reductase